MADKLLSPSMSTADRKATLMENQHHVGKSVNKSNTQQTTGTSVGSGTRSTSSSTGTAKASKTGTNASIPITVVTSLAREPAAVPMTNPTNGMVSPAAIKNSYSTLSGPAQREWVLDQFIGTFDGYGRQANAYEKMSEAAGQVYEALNKEFLEKYASTSDTSSREFMAYQEDNAREMNKVKADEKRWKALESEGR